MRADIRDRIDQFLTLAPRASRLPPEDVMIRMLSFSGAVTKGEGMVDGALRRNVKGKFVFRAEGVADLGPGDFFAGPFETFAQAAEVARRYAADEKLLRQHFALPQMWKVGTTPTGGARAEVIRIYEVTEDVPGVQTVAASQPERAGTVMVRPEHYEALRRKDPSLAHEYKGGANQLELPVKGLRTQYGIEIVQRIPGAEYRVTRKGTPF